MTIEDAPELLLLLRYSDSIELNANDFFCYASAGSIILAIDNMEWVLPIVKKYKENGIHAVMSYINKMLPIEPWQTEDFLKAYKELEKLNPLIIE
jgi:hypothetical protein